MTMWHIRYKMGETRNDNAKLDIHAQFRFIYFHWWWKQTLSKNRFKNMSDMGDEIRVRTHENGRVVIWLEILESCWKPKSTHLRMSHCRRFRNSHMWCGESWFGQTTNKLDYCKSSENSFEFKIFSTPISQGSWQRWNLLTQLILRKILLLQFASVLNAKTSK